jgi:hypothetical protein
MRRRLPTSLSAVDRSDAAFDLIVSAETGPAAISPSGKAIFVREHTQGRPNALDAGRPLHAAVSGRRAVCNPAIGQFALCTVHEALGRELHGDHTPVAEGNFATDVLTSAIVVTSHHDGVAAVRSADRRSTARVGPTADVHARRAFALLAAESAELLVG